MTAPPRVPVTVVTNAVAAGQFSMIGYGRMLVEQLEAAGWPVTERRGVSLFGRAVRRGRLGKLALQADRFLLTPLSMAGRGAGLVHVVDPGNALYPGLMRAGARIVTVHDMIPYLAEEGRLAGFRPSVAGRRLMRRILGALRRADRVVCVSEATKADLMRIAGVAEAAIRVIPNAVFRPFARVPEAERRAFRARHRLPEDGSLILSIGRNFYKNREGVLRIFARIGAERPDARLLFVSPPGSALGAQIAEAGLGDRVAFAPALPEESLSAAYSAADLLLFPSLYEGFGYPVVEAQLCGTPVVCSDAGSLAEVAGQGASVHPVEDEAGMADAALRLLSDGAAREALVARGTANAARFTPEAWLDAHERLYAELVPQVLR